ncbi:nucleotidyltransferase [Myxococcus sp. AB056]|uniref:nucleotidyltransferase domain-containing protein n=1 Tax=Myxococcus sp. AB056 TaxID=2562792 RepID=UPI0011475488|nr:nucleotidyltransferase [Myxococcus sp. AB056]
MTFQSLFRRFHEAIQLKRFSENAELIEKRDRVLKRLRENLEVPVSERATFEPFNQGSYAMGTGIKPLDGDYDIDVGIEFDIDYRRYTPVEVKRWVYKAIEGHTARVEWRRSCITVYYQQAGEPLYHVDLAIMARDRFTGETRLAVGKEHSATDQQEWQPDDRKGFMEAVESRFTGEDAAQFRRVIRYLKRWKDEHFPKEGHAAPTGLALTVAAYHWFNPSATWSLGTGSKDYDDLSATTALVTGMLRNFGQAWDGANRRYVPRLSRLLPAAPRDDVFERMSHQQMLGFHSRLRELEGKLLEAKRTLSTTALQRAFGDDFPVS